jgi:hypothetical protein
MWSLVLTKNGCSKNFEQTYERHLAPTHHRYTNFGCWQGFFRRFCNLSAETQKLRSFRNFVMETLELNWPTASLRVRGINTPSTPPLQLSWPNFVLNTGGAFTPPPSLPLALVGEIWWGFGEGIQGLGKRDCLWADFPSFEHFVLRQAGLPHLLLLEFRAPSRLGVAFDG